MAHVTETPGKTKTKAPEAPQGLIENADIHSLLPSPEQQKAELAVYDKLRQEFKKHLTEISEHIDREHLTQAADRAGELLKTGGSYTAEAIEKAGHALRKDIASTTVKLGKEWHNFSEKTADVFDVWRDRSSLFLGRAAKAVGEWLEEHGEKGEHPTYHTGDMAISGTFECNACGEHIELISTGYIPPCPKCYKTEFKRL